MSKGQCCDRGRLNISSIDQHHHECTLCVLPRGHTAEHAMAESMRAFHAAQGTDLGPWQPLAAMNDLANEERDRRGIPRVDYDGEIDPDVKKKLLELVEPVAGTRAMHRTYDSDGRPRREGVVGQTGSLAEAMALLHGIGKN